MLATPGLLFHIYGVDRGGSGRVMKCLANVDNVLPFASRFFLIFFFSCFTLLLLPGCKEVTFSDI